MEMTSGEKRQLDDILLAMNELTDYLGIKNINECVNIREIFDYIVKIKDIQGNINTSISYVSCLLAKEYLIKYFDVKNIDVSIKSQSARGLDIDTTLDNGKRVIAEIKTTDPCGKNDFGKQQKDNFKKDFEKLKNATSDYKFLFVTELKAFEILTSKYKNETKDVKIVLLE